MVCPQKLFFSRKHVLDCNYRAKNSNSSLEHPGFELHETLENICKYDANKLESIVSGEFALKIRELSLEFNNFGIEFILFRIQIYAIMILLIFQNAKLYVSVPPDCFQTKN